MQRPGGTSGASDDHCIISMPANSLKNSPRARTDDTTHSGWHRRKAGGSRFRIKEKCVPHFIPWIVVMCFVILFWFSYPVNVVIKDGRIVEIHSIDSLDDTHVDLTILAVAATSPDSSLFPDDQELSSANIDPTDPFNETHIDITILASLATSPYASLATSPYASSAPDQKLSDTGEIEGFPPFSDQYNA